MIQSNHQYGNYARGIPYLYFRGRNYRQALRPQIQHLYGVLEDSNLLTTTLNYSIFQILIFESSNIMS